MDLRDIAGQRFSGLLLLFMDMVRPPLKQLGSLANGIIFEDEEKRFQENILLHTLRNLK